MKILFVCERLGQRDDEGIRNLAQSLLEILSERHELLALTQDPGEGRANVVPISLSPFQRRTFLSPRLLRRAASFRPDVTLYIPWTSGTLPTFFRARVLRMATRSRVAIYLTQPYDNPGWQRWFIRYMLPELVLALSDTVVRHVAQLGAETEFVPAGVDLKRFDLPDAGTRARSRRRFGVADGEQLVLHVGHLNRNRMDPSEIRILAARPNRKIVIVGSTSTPQDLELAASLRAAGCTVIGEYLPDIEQLYAAADVYLFPTREQRSSIGIPLSVLEALATGVPVVTTRFEGLPRLFPATRHVQFFSSTAQLERAVSEVPAAPDPGARALVAQLSWPQSAATVERHLLGLTARPGLGLREAELPWC